MRATSGLACQRDTRRWRVEKTVWISLYADSATVAKHEAHAAWSNLIETREARLAGDTADAERRFEAASELVRIRGSRYLPAPQAHVPIDKLLGRVETLPVHDGTPDRLETAALLGGVPKPPITVTRALELYWALVTERTQARPGAERRSPRWSTSSAPC